MEEATSHLRSFSIRDGIILVGLSVVATYLLRVQQSFQLVPSWRCEISTGFYDDGQHTSNIKRLPIPLVADIESDGKNEILIATSDPSIILLKPAKPATESKALPFLNTIDEYSLLSGGESVEGKRPVAMATGYLEPLHSSDQVRKQVIVVLCADWTVVCLNSDFKQLWKKKLSNVSLSHHNFIREAAILILPHSLRADDGGLVIIGGRISHRQAHRTLRHNHDHGHNAHKSDDVNEASDSSPDVEHFSTFALSGHHGDIRWHHLPGDFEEEINTEEDLFKGVHFKLALKKGWGHRGELGWNQYNQAFLSQMPYRWQTSSDTKIEIAAFTKDGIIKSQVRDENDHGTLSVSSFVASNFEEHIVGHHFGGLPPHAAAEHVKNPTAVVIHSQEGLEVLEMTSGRPLTRLKLRPDATYADINKDGVIDQSRAHFSDTENADNCLAVVRSGHPPHTLLFNGSICNPSSLWAALSYPWAYMMWSTDIKENQQLILTPLIVNSVANRRGVISHLLGLSLTKPGMDSIFTVSDGRVTSYGPQGHFNWQVSTSAVWSEHHIITSVKGQIDQDLLDTYHDLFVPSIQPLSTQVFGKRTAAMLAGWDHVVLLSLETGTVLAEHTLPCQPTAPLIIGDFDDDGWNDVVVPCTHSYLGISLRRYTGYWATAFIGLAVVVIVTALVATCTPDEKPLEGAAREDELGR